MNRHKNILIVTFILVAIVILGCNYINSRKESNCSDNTITSIRLKFSMPALDQNKRLVYISDTMLVFYYKNLIMFQMPVVYTSQRDALDEKEKILSNYSIQINVSSKYLIYEKGNNTGLMFDSITSISHKFKVDSFLSTKWIIGFKPLYLKDKKNDSLIESVKENNILIEKFAPKAKYDASYNDSAYYYYRSDLQDIDFSFSREEDSLKRMKLFKILVVYNSNSDATDLYQRLAKTFEFSFEKVPVINSAIANLFGRYLREKKEE